MYNKNMMKDIGEISWVKDYDGTLLEEFLDLYKSRPLRTNQGGMGINHSYALFFILRKLMPNHVIESGVYSGQSTWLIEQALPHAEIYSLDPVPGFREYTSSKAKYLLEDFTGLDWSALDAEKTVCFFDDHQSAFSRLKDLKWWGFKHAVFEDNYPLSQGDCYSLRQVLSGAGHPRPNLTYSSPSGLVASLKEFLKGLLGRRAMGEINNHVNIKLLEDIYWRQEIIRKPNQVDRVSAMQNISVYCEMAPLLLNKTQRWNDHPWSGEYSLSRDALFGASDECPALSGCIGDLNRKELISELSYTYIAYVQLK